MQETTAIHLLKKPLHTELNDRKENKKAYELLSRTEYFEPLEFLTPNVYLVEGEDLIALVNKETETIDYYVTLKKIKVEGINALYQSMLWRTGASKYVGAIKGHTSLAGYVFYQYVMPKSNMILISDSEQTDKGQSFWFNRLKEAFHKGYRVFIIKDHKVIAELPNYDEVIRLEDEIWGKGKRHIRLAISTLSFDVPKVTV